MSVITITDPILLAKIAETKDYLELRDPAGFCIGRVEREWLGKLPPGMKSPLTDEEFESRRNDPDAGTLSEILAELDRRVK